MAPLDLPTSVAGETLLEEMAVGIHLQRLKVCQVGTITQGTFKYGDLVTLHVDNLVPGKWLLTRV